MNSLVSDIICIMTKPTNNKGADQQNQQNGLCAQQRLRSAWAFAEMIRVFAVRSTGSQGPKVSSCGQRRL